MTIEGLVRVCILTTDVKLPLKCRLFLKAKISVTVQQSCCLSCPPSGDWFLAVKKMFNSVKHIQPMLHTTSNYIKTEEECVAISFQRHWVISLEENGCFYGNNWTLMFLMLLSDLDCSGLFLSELCLCFVVFKYIWNRVNLNQTSTSHFIKYTMKCLNLCVVNFLLHSTRKS